MICYGFYEAISVERIHLQLNVLPSVVFVHRNRWSNLGKPNSVGLKLQHKKQMFMSISSVWTFGSLCKIPLIHVSKTLVLSMAEFDVKFFWSIDKEGVWMICISFFSILRMIPNCDLIIFFPVNTMRTYTSESNGVTMLSFSLGVCAFRFCYVRSHSFFFFFFLFICLW